MDDNSEDFYKEIFSLLKNVENKILDLATEIEEQGQKIADLETSKILTERKYETLHSKVKDYLQELEEIRNYVNSNNQSCE
ncbi:MAG: hypothetical protein ISN64_04210 [Rickettsia sp.]|nr:hypothetical protein [Rickettsia sp.]